MTPQSKTSQYRSVLRPAASYLIDALRLALVGALRLVSLPIRRTVPRRTPPQERRQRLGALSRAVAGNSHARPSRGVVLGVPGEPHTLMSSSHADCSLSKKKKFLIPDSSPFHPPSTPVSCHESTRVVNISHRAALSPAPFRARRTSFHPIYFDTRPRPLGSSKPYLPPNPRRTGLCSPHLSSLFLSLSVLVLVLILLITVCRANTSTANILSPQDSDDCFESPLGES